MADAGPLSVFELPPPLLTQALAASRGFNTALDVAFYDVPTLVEGLRTRGEATLNTKPSALDLDAMLNPEGAILVIDPMRAPYVSRFDAVPDFLAWHGTADPKPEIASITGVGSSALGSAALAWNIAEARGAPVIAVVPGYGVADAILQGIGGFFGFELYDALNAKSSLQDMLANFAPALAWTGRRLAASSPGSRRAATGAPVFLTGSGSSDVLHALLGEIRLRLVVGHSKGALAVANALRSLEPAQIEGLTFITLGCVVPEELQPNVAYAQFLGLFDALGRLNSLGQWPETWVPADHSTNRRIPLSMNAEALVTP